MRSPRISVKHRCTATQNARAVRPKTLPRWADSPQRIVEVAIIRVGRARHCGHWKALQPRQTPQACHCYLRAQHTPLTPAALSYTPITLANANSY